MRSAVFESRHRNPIDTVWVVQSLGKRDFVDELIAVTRERDATAYLYVMLRENGDIGVQWEQPGVDHLREYRIVEPGGSGCPHCAIIDAALQLSAVLPLDLLRMARLQTQYERVLRAGMLPSPAFARQSMSRDVTWLADCHGAPGNPHTAADCAEHAALGPAVVNDRLDIDLAEAALPRAVREMADLTDVERRLRLARDWRETAGEVARHSRFAETAWGFLQSSAVLGVPVPGMPGLIYALETDAGADDRPLTELYAAAVQSSSGQEALRYSDRICLLSDPSSGHQRMPSSAGALDLVTGRPVRTLHLPSSHRPLSRRGRGILLLFETRHAMLTRYVGPSTDWQSEAALHIFEFGILEELGGDAYTSAVTAYLQALHKEGDLLARPRKVLGRNQLKTLARIFGDIDDEEVHLWASVAYRNAILLMLGSQSAFAEHLRHQTS